MNILVINGSPKGRNSITLQTSLFWQILNPQHQFRFLDVGLKIKVYEKHFEEVENQLDWADLIIFSYPVYTFLIPSQLQRFIELLFEYNIDLSDKWATQISTSKHFYDVTAHKYIEQNCLDLKTKYICGLSMDMDDLLTEKGQRQAELFFKYLMLQIENNNYIVAHNHYNSLFDFDYEIDGKLAIAHNEEKRIVIVSCYLPGDEMIQKMVKYFKDHVPYHVEEFNLMEFPFQGGCLGCFNCAINGHCFYRDGFENFLRNQIQTADSIIYAFPIKHHYTYYQMKMYDDRQFCNGHRQVIEGTPIGYLISGDYEAESNLKTMIESRCEVGGTFLCGVANQNENVTISIDNLISNLKFALTTHIQRPKNFYGVGGTLIFRDLIYQMQGLMKADHKFYKKSGVYNTFPQKNQKRIWQMRFVGAIMQVPSVRKKMKNKMNDFILMPYKKVLEDKKSE